MRLFLEIKRSYYFQLTYTFEKRSDKIMGVVIQFVAHVRLGVH